MKGAKFADERRFAGSMFNKKEEKRVKIHHIVASALLCACTLAYAKKATKSFYTIQDNEINRFQPWRPIQNKIKDTVVQVFSQIAEYDWIQPFRTPSQYTARGSGFFITDEGHLVTNAHVVDQAVSIWIQIPSLGKRLIDVDIICIYPERDLALLQIVEQDREIIRKALGSIPFLELGDSDSVRRADEALAVGYPLGQSLKSTTGIISGREQGLIQTSTAINPGSSGGPLISIEGKVIGINSSGVVAAQNVGYAIPINDLKIVLPSITDQKVLRKPFLGILSTKANDHLTQMLGNPQPGGCYVVEVLKGSPLDRIGVQADDMIYEINGEPLDIYGEISVPWSEERVSVTDYLSRFPAGEELNLVVYRQGDRLEFTVTIDYREVASIRKFFPWHETVDYEVFAGMVIMPLTVNHMQLMGESVPGLLNYMVPNLQTDPVLVVTHIFPNSEVARLRTVSPGFTITEVNGYSVQTIDDFRDALRASLDSDRLVMRFADQMSRASTKIPVVLPFGEVVDETVELSKMYHYPVSEAIAEIANELNKDLNGNSWY